MTASISNMTFAFLSVVIAAGIYGSYLGSRSENKKLKTLAMFFVLFSLYQVCLAYFLFFDNLYLAAWIYNLAIAILFIMLVLVIKIAMGIFGLSESNRNFAYFSLIFIGAIVIAIQIYDFRLPIINEDGITDWNANGIAARATSLSVFLVSLAWAASFLKNFSAFETIGQKIKAVLLAIGGAFLGLSGLTTYHSYDKEIAVISHAFAFAGGFLILATLLFYRRNRDK